MADVTVGNATHAALFNFAAEEAIDRIVPTSVARFMRLRRSRYRFRGRILFPTRDDGSDSRAKSTE